MAVGLHDCCSYSDWFIQWCDVMYGMCLLGGIQGIIEIVGIVVTSLKLHNCI